MPDDVQQSQVSPAPPASQGEHMIPKSRFDEVNEERRKLSERLAALETERQAETEKRLQDNQQWKELAEKRAQELADAQQKAARADVYEKSLTDVLLAQVAEIPADRRSLIPDELSTPQKLSWIAKNRALLVAPRPFDIGAGVSGGGQGSTVTLTPEEMVIARQFNMTPEEYAKYSK